MIEADAHSKHAMKSRNESEPSLSCPLRIATSSIMFVTWSTACHFKNYILCSHRLDHWTCSGLCEISSASRTSLRFAVLMYLQRRDRAHTSAVTSVELWG